MNDSLPATTTATEMSAGRAAPAIEAGDLVKTNGGKVRALDYAMRSHRVLGIGNWPLKAGKKAWPRLNNNGQ